MNLSDEAIMSLIEQRDSLNEKVNELENIIERGDEIANNWENNCYQEAVHYNWLDDQNTKLQDLLNESLAILEVAQEGENIQIIENFFTKVKESGYVYYFGK